MSQASLSHFEEPQTRARAACYADNNGGTTPASASTAHTPLSRRRKCSTTSRRREPTESTAKRSTPTAKQPVSPKKRILSIAELRSSKRSKSSSDSTTSSLRESLSTFMPFLEDDQPPAPMTDSSQSYAETVAKSISNNVANDGLDSQRPSLFESIESLPLGPMELSKPSHVVSESLRSQKSGGPRCEREESLTNLQSSLQRERYTRSLAPSPDEYINEHEHRAFDNDKYDLASAVGSTTEDRLQKDTFWRMAPSAASDRGNSGQLLQHCMSLKPRLDMIGSAISRLDAQQDDIARQLHRYQKLLRVLNDAVIESTERTELDTICASEGISIYDPLDPWDMYFRSATSNNVKTTHMEAHQHSCVSFPNYNSTSGESVLEEPLPSVLGHRGEKSDT